MQLLLVEDDSLLGGGLRAALCRSGFSVTWVREGQAALDLLTAGSFAAMLLDMGLPGVSGMDVLCRLRAEGMSLPVIILTALDTTRDKVVSLNNGADDYLVKTIEMEELIARVRALIRRAGVGCRSLSVGGLTLDLDAHTLTHQGQAVSVSRREFLVLRTLMEGAGRVLTRSQIERALYGWNGGVDSNAVEVHIHNLRAKLGPSCLKTIRGIGYTIASAGP
jgi:DNA-binding response OmpR family regulator